MILDGHCHIWENWPYQPPVPDAASRARAEQLLYEMDANRVERAVVICARLGDNAGNVDYAFEAARRHRGRLIVFPDLECKWAADYRTPGARDRLADALGRSQFAGFTMYLDEAEDGSWLTSDEGLAFFALAVEHRLIASLSVMPHQAPAVTALAEAFPPCRSCSTISLSSARAAPRPPTVLHSCSLPPAVRTSQSSIRGWAMSLRPSRITPIQSSQIFPASLRQPLARRA
jgi:predicted TIM-barrel fold metal-dependent hydrolase